MEANESSRVSDDLTSTAESVLTNNGHEKKINHSDSISVGDSTPSSSSDANMQTSIIKTVHDDPISSTSDSLTHENEMNLNILTSDLNFIAGVETSGSTNDIGTDSDFFTSELSIGSIVTEKISEDVEDIANDLENLLGETTHSYGVICTNSVVVTNTGERLKEISTSITSISSNLLVDHAEVDISGEDILQVEIGADKPHAKTEVLASKDVDFCNNSDILEANKKTESPVEYSSVDISNNDGKLIHTNVSEHTQDGKVSDDVSRHVNTSSEVESMGIGVNREDNALHIRESDINAADFENALLKKADDEEIPAEKDSNEESVVVEENTNNLDLLVENRKLNEDKPNFTQSSATDEADENVLVAVKTTSVALQPCEVDVFQETIAVDKKDASNENLAVTSGNVENMDDSESTTVLESLGNIEAKEEIEMTENNLNREDLENMMVEEEIENSIQDAVIIEEEACEIPVTQFQVEDKSFEAVVDGVATAIFTTAENAVTDGNTIQFEDGEQSTEQQILIEAEDENEGTELENINDASSQEENISDLKDEGSNMEQSIAADKIVEAQSVMQLINDADVKDVEEKEESHDLEEGASGLPQIQEERKEECKVVIIQEEENEAENYDKHKEDKVNLMDYSINVPEENQEDKDTDNTMDGVIVNETIEHLPETSDEVSKLNLDMPINLPVESNEEMETSKKAPTELATEVIEHADVNMTIDSVTFTNKEEVEERGNELISTQTEIVTHAENIDVESSDLSANTEAVTSANLTSDAIIPEEFETNAEQLEEMTKDTSKDDATVLDLPEEQPTEEDIEFKNNDRPILEEKLEPSEEIIDNVTKNDLNEKNVLELQASHHSEIIQSENEGPEESQILEKTDEMNKEPSPTSFIQETVQSTNVDIAECIESISTDQKLADTLITKSDEVDVTPIEKNVDVIENQKENNEQMPTSEIKNDENVEINDEQMCPAKLHVESSAENNEELMEISEAPETATTSDKQRECLVETVEKDDVASTESKLDDNIIQEAIPNNDEQVCASQLSDEILSKQFKEINETETGESESLCDIQINKENEVNSQSSEVGQIEKVNLLPMELDVISEAEVNKSGDREQSQSDDTLELISIKNTVENKNSDLQERDATQTVDRDVIEQNVEADKNDKLMDKPDEADTVSSVQDDIQEVATVLDIDMIQDEVVAAPENADELECNEKIELEVESEPPTEVIKQQENSDGKEKLESCKSEEDLGKIEAVTQKVAEEVAEIAEDITILVKDNTEMLPDSSGENLSGENKFDPNLANMQSEGADENLQQTTENFVEETLPLIPEDPQVITDDDAQPVEQETADSSTEQSLAFISEDAQIIENVAGESDASNSDQKIVQTPFSMFDKEEPQTNVQNQDVIQLHEENYGLNIDESPEEQIETMQTVDYCSVQSTSDEPSELQCAISQIVDDMQPTDNSETSELQSAISHIIDSPEIISDSNLTDNTPLPQMDSSETMDECQTFELQTAISQIVYSSDSTDDSKSAELQSAICQIIDNSEETEEDSELQNAITQIINTPELETNSKNDEVLDIQIEQQITEDNLDNKAVTIDQDNQLNDSELFETAKQSQEETELKPIEKEVKFDESEEKINSEVEIQSMYSQPVVDLMLDDMDDQLKHVIFEPKSEDSSVNIPTISEVSVDTPKTFESQHIELMLPEESSLLNTDDIISEIAPGSQNLDDQVIPEAGLKIAELHRSDSKDLNDVIAREIESLLELQTQGLSEDTGADNVSSDTNKINEEIQINEEKKSDLIPGGSSYRDAEKLEEKVPTEDPTRISVESEKIFHDSVTEEVSEPSNDSKRKHVLPGEVDVVEKEYRIEKIRQKQDADYSYDDLKSDTTEKSVGEVSSTTVVNTAVTTNQEVDYQRTPTKVEHSRNEPVKPLLIEVGTSIDNNSQLQANIAISTSNYSSKMSENEDLKMTITKHKIESTSKAEIPLTNETHSILKIYDPKDTMDSKKSQKMKEATVPKLIIKPIVKSQPSPTPSAKIEETERETVPKLFIRNMSPNRPGSPKVVKSQKSEITSPLKLTIKPVLKPEECQSKSSPKLTIKPIVKTEEESSTSGPKITIKPIIKPPEEELCHSPKITIKPIIKPDDCQSEMVHSPRITIKPIPKPDDLKEYTTSDIQSSRITIKPVLKAEGCNSPEQEMLKRTSDIDGADRSHSPRITIKPILKPEEHKSIKQDQKSKQEEFSKLDKKEGSPKITIKPVVKPVENEGDSVELIDFEDQIKQERIVLKINKNSMAKDSRKRDSTEEIEKLAKIKLKFSKEGGHAHIVSEQSKLKRALEESIDCDQKRTKFESDDLTITPIDADAKKTEKVVDIIKDDVNITPINPTNRPLFEDPLEKIPVFEITPESAVIMKSSIATTVQQVTAPTPRKRGRPRKVPLVVREEFKDVKEEEILQQEQPAPEDTGRPKRSCRGPSVRTTLGIRTRKPRGSGRGRGRGRGARGVGSRGGRQQRVSAAKLKLLKEEAAAAIAEQSQSLEPEDGGDVEMKDEPPAVEDVSSETAEIVLIEEETRMSADINISRAQTPAKQGDNSVPTPGDVEDTQSSVQSTATTESTKGRKGTRTEVHQEPEGEVISADQLTEYYWGGGGPYMLQEQVAQFLGIKSFKRKYPGIQRRTVDMQERDFIRESGLVSEAMCDLGLTAVHSADILDIMYSDFQHKYEEYCKHQRDRQAKDFSNKQKALSLAASQEKNKHDIVQQAVQSAASWNTNFNKSRRDERKACMDLQTFTIHYPKGRFKNVDRNKTGHYPVALVPGQYTDYYKNFTPAELSNLPINTMLNKPVNISTEDDSPSDGSGSDSDSSSSDSDSSSSSSSGEDCNICSPSSSNQTKKVLAN